MIMAESIYIDEGERALELAEDRHASEAETELGGDEASSSETRAKIKAGAMVAFAVISDIVSAIPVVGNFFGGLAWVIIVFWIHVRGLKRPPKVLLMGVVELVPILSVLPTITFMVLLTIRYNNQPS